MNQPLLTICIPTNGAIQWVLPTVRAIYEQNCDNSLFEVVVADNGENEQLGENLEDMGHPNLIYRKTNAVGFENQICAFKCGNGSLIKMINHRSIIKKGYLQKLIDFVKDNIDEKPTLYFSNGALKKDASVVGCENFDAFVRKASFWCSWEEGVGVWKEDIPQIESIKINSLFPAASMLFGIKKDSRFVIFNEQYSTQQRAIGHIRQYDFFDAFALEFLDMLNELRREKRISIETFNFVRRDNFRRNLISRYFQIMIKKNDGSIPLNNIKEKMSVYYRSIDYYWMLFYSHVILRIKDR